MAGGRGNHRGRLAAGHLRTPRRATHPRRPRAGARGRPSARTALDAGTVHGVRRHRRATPHLRRAHVRELTTKGDRMHLTPTEIERLSVFTAAELARRNLREG